jgi:RNA polymerase sigma-70 factor (ECF subfamily)
VAEHLSMTAAAAKMATSRLRRRYRELLRDEIAQTVCDPDEIDQEIRDLFVAFGN